MRTGFRKLPLLLFIVFTFFSCSDELVPEEEFLAAEETEANLPPETKATSSNFLFGINGHPLGTEPYKSMTAKEQISLLKDMGMNVYRFSLHSMSDGRVTVPYLFNPLVKACQEADVTMLPVLTPRTLDLSLQYHVAYKRGYKLGKNFAQQYGHLFTYYELANELDNKCILSGAAGASRASYDMKKFTPIAGYLKGMNNGIKAADPNAQTMINMSWLHYGFLWLLEDWGVDFDILALHWYSEMENIAPKKPYYIPDITKHLSQRFNKPIWITEVNTRPKDVSDMEERQHEFLTDFLAKCKKNPQVKAFIIYELLDEPHRNGYYEQNYGIIKWTNPYTKWAHKLVAKTLIGD